MSNLTKYRTISGAPAGPPMLHSLIIYAWAIEVVGVGCGILNAGYTTFGDKLPDTVFGYLSAIPMVVLAVAELGRVPLTSAFFHRSMVMRGVCLLAIIALSLLAVENWTIGFERLYSMRLSDVMSAASAVVQAEAAVLALKEDSSLEANAQKRAELRSGMEARERSIAAMADQIQQAGEAHRRNLENIGQQCRAVRGPCIKPRSDAEDQRYGADFANMNEARAIIVREKTALQTEIDGLVKVDALANETLARKRMDAVTALNARRDDFRRAVDSNPIYRIATSWFGTNQLTPEQFSRTRWWFSTISAVVIAIIGSIAAFVHHRGATVPRASSVVSVQTAKLIRSLRAYLARKRKAIVREVPVFRDGKEVVFRDGREVVTKEVIRYVDRVVFVPRWGIGLPSHISSIWQINPFRFFQDRPANDNRDASTDQRVQ